MAAAIFVGFRISSLTVSPRVSSRSAGQFRGCRQNWTRM